jgi:uncharacterized membrane-anchored protein
MTSDDTGAQGFVAHPARDAALEELHARPSLSIAGEACVARFVFVYEAQYAGRDHELISALCGEAGVEPPGPGARALHFTWKSLETRWERHNEFVTYTFISHGGPKRSFETARARLQEAQPGPLVTGLRLAVHRAPPGATVRAIGGFTCASLVSNERAIVETSFQADVNGMVDISLSCSDLSPGQTGALAQWALEFETYRMLALIALPIARKVGAMVRDTEILLGELTRRLADQKIGESTEALYLQLTELAGRIEAEITSSTYRFAAARAYGAIVEDRLSRLGERSLDERSTVGSFLVTRLTPALRTCESMQSALQDLARRTARAADLIRTRIDLQLSRQNIELLQTLNQRTKIQMRLQQTVEGLSVAAVSYYILGLIGYLAKGAKEAGLSNIEPGIVIAALMPIVVLSLAFAVLRVRRSHSE